MDKNDKWVFLDKLFCPSEKLVIADSNEVFGGSEELEQVVPKRPLEDLEEDKTKKAVARVSAECLALSLPDRYILIYGRKRQQDGQLVELRILLDPLLDDFQD